MNRKPKRNLKPFFAGGLLAIALATTASIGVAHASTAAIYGGGPFYSGGQSVMNAVRLSGYNTVVLWTIHINSSNGDLVLNDQLVASNGSYVGNAAWPGLLASLRQQPTSVNRIEICVGSWGVDDFGSARTLMNTQGTGSTSILYRNFQALKNATGADAINFDDEVLYDATATVRFGQMLGAIGYKVSLCPYTNTGFWQSVKSQLGSTVDAVYLQCYDGGAGNNPATWNSLFGGLKVIPGVWGRHNNNSAGDTPDTVQSKMAGWRSSAGTNGGFIWLYDDVQNTANGYGPIEYASAIHAAYGDAKPAFQIVNQNSGKALDLIGGSLGNSSRINQWSFDANGKNQRWIPYPSEGGNHFILVSGVSGRAASIENDSTADGAQLQAYDYTGNDTSQQWDLLDAGSGWFNIRNVRSGKVLDVLNFNTADDGKIQQWTNSNNTAQRFRLQPWGNYFIRAASGKCICVQGAGSSNGNGIIQYTQQDNPWFKWRFEGVGDGNLRTTSLNATGRVLCVVGGSATAAANCHLWDYNPANAGDQKVRIVPQLNGRYKFYFVHDGRAGTSPAARPATTCPCSSIRTTATTGRSSLWRERRDATGEGVDL
ncbi:MAG: type domain protein [Akkermansiaceae bacterium]|nr:type domain protein [Akkermansiaceae bacterium]